MNTFQLLIEIYSVLTLISRLGGFKDEAKGTVVIDKGLDPGTIRNELLVVLEPLDLWDRVSDHFALQLGGGALHGLGGPQQGAELGLLHGLGHGHLAGGGSLTHLGEN